MSGLLTVTNEEQAIEYINILSPPVNSSKRLLSNDSSNEALGDGLLCDAGIFESEGKEMIAHLTAALLSVVFVTVAVAQENSPATSKLRGPIAIPEYRIGDRWVYQGTNLQTKQTTYKIEQVVESVDGARAVFRVTDLAATKGQASKESATQAYLISAQSNLRSDLISGIFENAHFPLDVGTTWDHNLKRHYFEGDVIQGEYKAKAVAWEEVTVPAGTFWTIRIEHEGMWRRPEKRTSGREMHTIWYSPDAKRNVKAISVDYDTANGVNNQSETELIEYELVKR